MDNITIYNLPTSPPSWDRVGIFHLSFCLTWTTLLFSGMVFCWFNRYSPSLRLRGLPLSFVAITFLHAYWILGQIVYPIGRTIPIVIAYDVQYFFMGIWFPLGIALFHASNSRFLYVAKMQKQFTHPYLPGRLGCNGSRSSWFCRLRNMDYSKRIMIFIAFGMILQVLLAVGMWLACLKYHPTYGIPGTEIRGATLPEQIIDLGRGWEWWPSVLWQVVWTWIVAPVLLYRAWGIRDTMGWRIQTIGCCLSNLHATPMFLIASYVPAFDAINLHFPPSQWIHLSIMMFEIFTVFVPVLAVIRFKILTKKAAHSSARWESASQVTTLRESTSLERKASFTVSEQTLWVDSLEKDQGDRLFTISALDHILEINPGPLQDFSALSDFSGENIAFLTNAARWKSSWPQTPGEDSKLEAYNRALIIYINFISPRDAEFPLNISSQDLKFLEYIFEGPARSICGEACTNPATPFAYDVEQAPAGSSSNRAQYKGDIPIGFNLRVFDSVQSHVRDLVFTNTWPKFVKEMQQRRRSGETERSAFTSSSQSTLVSRVSNLIHSLL